MRCKLVVVLFFSIMAGLSTPVWAIPFSAETILNPSDDTAGTQYDYGRSVAINGNRAIVGSPNDDEGSAYLYDVTTGSELFKLTASDASAYDSFGRSVAISGNIAIIGSDSNDAAGDASGAVYLFDVTTGNELFKLTGEDTTTRDVFGFSVAISGNTAIVGAQWDDDAGSQSGSAYLFDVTTGNELFKLAASDAEAEDRFGHSVAIGDNTAIVGSFYNDDAGVQSGSAYLFDVSTGNELFKLTASDAALGDGFGFSVATSDDIAIVGSPWNDDSGNRSGSAYLIDVLTGNELMKLTASDASAGDWFGVSVAINGNTAIVGAQGDDGVGSAYLFDLTTGNELMKFTASDAVTFDKFGYSVGISGNTAIVGTQVQSGGGGSAYLFTPEPSSMLLAILGLLGLSTTRHRNRVEPHGR